MIWLKYTLFSSLFMVGLGHGLTGAAMGTGLDSARCQLLFGQASEAPNSDPGSYRQSFRSLISNQKHLLAEIDSKIDDPDYLAAADPRFFKSWRSSKDNPALLELLEERRSVAWVHDHYESQSELLSVLEAAMAAAEAHDDPVVRAASIRLVHQWYDHLLSEAKALRPVARSRLEAVVAAVRTATRDQDYVIEEMLARVSQRIKSLQRGTGYIQEWSEVLVVLATKHEMSNDEILAFAGAWKRAYEGQDALVLKPRESTVLLEQAILAKLTPEETFAEIKNLAALAYSWNGFDALPGPVLLSLWLTHHRHQAGVELVAARFREVVQALSLNATMFSKSGPSLVASAALLVERTWSMPESQRGEWLESLNQPSPLKAEVESAWVHALALLKDVRSDNKVNALTKAITSRHASDLLELWLRAAPDEGVVDALMAAILIKVAPTENSWQWTPEYRTALETHLAFGYLNSRTPNKTVVLLLGNAWTSPSAEVVAQTKAFVERLVGSQQRIIYDADSQLAPLVAHIAGKQSVGVSAHRSLPFDPGASQVLTIANPVLRLRAFGVSGKVSIVATSDSLVGLGLASLDFPVRIWNTGGLDPKLFENHFKQVRDVSPLRKMPSIRTEWAEIYDRIAGDFTPDGHVKDFPTFRPAAHYGLLAEADRLAVMRTVEHELRLQDALRRATSGPLGHGVYFGTKKRVEPEALKDLIIARVTAMAKSGRSVRTGGGSGTMALANRAALEAGVPSIGITYQEEVRTNFHTQTLESISYDERIPLLLKDVDAILIGPGRTGTLREIAAYWASLHPTSSQTHLEFVGSSYRPTVELLQAIGLPASQELHFTH